MNREPFFGPGWPILVWVAIGVAIKVIVKLWVIGGHR